MNNLGKSLLVASFAIGAANATGSTNKTFFSGRPVGVNLAMEGTTWHKQINNPTDVEDKFDAALQVTGFYQENTNEDALGKYFGFQNKNNLIIGAAGSTTDVDHRFLLHDQLNVLLPAQSVATFTVNNARLTGTIDLQYQHEAAGFRIDYQQDLDNVLEGLFVRTRTPMVWQRSGVNLNLTNSVTATVNANGSTHSGNTTTVSIADYFSGNLTQTTNHIAADFNVGQAALAYAKIDGKQESSGTADVDVIVGWNFKEKMHSMAGVYTGITIPTSPTPDGRFLGDGWYGNHGHWAAGAGMNARTRLFGSENSSLNVDFALDWKYLFRETEVRTLGLKGKDWGQYLFLAATDSHNAIPAANILTLPVDVYVGNRVDARLGLSYNWRNLVLDLGYNLYAKEAEHVSFNHNSFPDDQEVFIALGNDASSNDLATSNSANLPLLDISSSQPSSTNSYLHSVEVDPTVAETPSQVTHKVYGGLGYAFNMWSQPLMLGIGGSYEGYSSQIALENWALWAKVGLAF